MRKRRSALKLTDEQRQLVEDNLGIAKKAAHDLRAHCTINRLSMEDAAAEGYLALCWAARAFDPARGVKFSTYGYMAARQRIRRVCGQNNIIRPPHYIAEAPGFRQPWVFSTDVPIELDDSSASGAEILEDPNANTERDVLEWEMIRWYGEGLSPTLRRTYDMLVSDMPKYHIARAEQVSYQAIDSRIKSIRKIIHRKVAANE